MITPLMTFICCETLANWPQTQRKGQPINKGKIVDQAKGILFILFFFQCFLSFCKFTASSSTTTNEEKKKSEQSTRGGKREFVASDNTFKRQTKRLSLFELKNK